MTVVKAATISSSKPKPKPQQLQPRPSATGLVSVSQTIGHRGSWCRWCRRRRWPWMYVGVATVVAWSVLQQIANLAAGYGDWPQNQHRHPKKYPKEYRYYTYPVPGNDGNSSSNSGSDYRSHSHSQSHSYIQYTIEGGWANQVVCLKNAYTIAVATGRGLILSPVKPHFSSFFSKQDYLKESTQEFELGYDLRIPYLQKLSPYIPLRNVLDIKASLPGLVEARDFRDFYNDVNIYNSLIDMDMGVVDFDGAKDKDGSSLALAASTTAATAATATAIPWPMEASVSHYNTRWIKNRSALEGTQTTIDTTEYGKPQHYNQTYRDIVSFSKRSPASDHPIWTLLDSYKVRFHESVIDDRGLSFQPRFAPTIRAASDAVRHDRWKGIPYASVHIRGSDGRFKKSREDAIETALKNVGDAIVAWLDEKAIIPTTTAKAANTTTSTSTSSPSPSPSLSTVSSTTNTVGLFVATDIPNLRKNSVFRKQTSALQTTLKRDYRLDLKLLFADDDEKAKKSMLPALEALLDRRRPDYCGYPEIFLDQQLAACATIGFVGTKRSTFSKFIDVLRKNDDCKV